MSTGKKQKLSPAELKAENERLAKENARLQLKLQKAEAMLELQKKAAEIIEMVNKEAEAKSKADSSSS